MKKMLFVIGIVLTQMLNAQQIFAPQVKWQINQNRDRYVADIVESNNGHYVLAGQDSASYLEEFDSVGNIFWRKNLDSLNTTGWGNVSNLLKVTDGYVIAWSACAMVSGPQDGTYRSIRILKTDFGGNILWDRYYGDTLKQRSSYSVILINDSTYAISGIESFGSPNVQVSSFLMCINASGTMLWYKNHSFGYLNGQDFAVNLVLLNDGFGQLIQSSLQYFPYMSCHFLKMDSQGDSVSVINFPNFLSVFSLTKSNHDNSLLFTGAYWDTVSTSTIIETTMKFNQNDSLLGQNNKSYPNFFYRDFISVKSKVDSGFIQVENLLTDTCGGIDSCFCPIYNFTKVTRLSENGDTLWTKKIGGTKGHSVNIYKFTPTSDGGVILEGQESDTIYWNYPNPNTHIIILKLGPDSLFCSSSTTNQITSDTVHSVVSSVNNYVLVNVDTVLNSIITTTDSVFISTKNYTTQIVYDTVVTTTNCVGLTSIVNHPDTAYFYSSIIDTAIHEHIDTVNLIITGIKEAVLDKCSVYPNPTSGQLILHLENVKEKDKINFSLYDETGKLIKDEKIQTEQTIFSLNDLRDGSYFFNIYKSNQIIKTGKVILVK